MSGLFLATWLVRALGVYAGLGVVFAVVFALRGIERVDPGARGSGWGFRLLVLPGVVALWPLLARRWFAAANGGRS
jgi:hypothetical protein